MCEGQTSSSVIRTERKYLSTKAALWALAGRGQRAGAGGDGETIKVASYDWGGREQTFQTTRAFLLRKCI